MTAEDGTPQHVGSLPPEDDSPTGEDDCLVFSAEALRAVDRAALDRYGLPAIVLMENAARGLADAIIDRIAPASDCLIIVLAGPGNNGGDGLAAARHLRNRGHEVAIALSSTEPRTPEARVHLRTVREMGLTVIDASRPDGLTALTALASSARVVIIDALLGTGMSRAPEGAVGTLIEWTNEARSRGAIVVSADIPSGLCADTGESQGIAVRAHLTVTFAGLKQGFMTLPAQSHLGDVAVVDIGVPKTILDEFGRRPDPPSHHACSSLTEPTLAIHGIHPGSTD